MRGSEMQGLVDALNLAAAAMQAQVEEKHNTQLALLEMDRKLEAALTLMLHITRYLHIPDPLDSQFPQRMSNDLS
jgi:hypothetical protein